MRNSSNCFDLREDVIGKIGKLSLWVIVPHNPWPPLTNVIMFLIMYSSYQYEYASIEHVGDEQKRRYYRESNSHPNSQIVLSIDILVN